MAATDTISLSFAVGGTHPAPAIAATSPAPCHGCDRRPPHMHGGDRRPHPAIAASAPCHGGDRRPSPAEAATDDRRPLPWRRPTISSLPWRRRPPPLNGGDRRPPPPCHNGEVFIFIRRRGHASRACRGGGRRPTSCYGGDRRPTHIHGGGRRRPQLPPLPPPPPPCHSSEACHGGDR